jgi:cytochrome c556
MPRNHANVRSPKTEDWMKMKLGLAAAAVAVSVATLAYANEDVIVMRQALMKANGQAMKIVVTMAKGDMPFDATVAMAALGTIANDAEEFPSFFPEGSETGDTRAGAAIWSDPDGFKATSDKLAADATAAAEAASTLEGLQGALGSVGSNCQACHEQYRNS